MNKSLVILKKLPGLFIKTAFLLFLSRITPEKWEEVQRGYLKKMSSIHEELDALEQLKRTV